LLSSLIQFLSGANLIAHLILRPRCNDVMDKIVTVPFRRTVAIAENKLRLIGRKIHIWVIYYIIDSAVHNTLFDAVKSYNFDESS
jgi:hypothetical protein